MGAMGAAMGAEAMGGEDIGRWPGVFRAGAWLGHARSFSRRLEEGCQLFFCSLFILF